MKNTAINKVPLALAGLVALLMLGVSYSFAYADKGDKGDGPIVGTPSITESKALAIAEKTYTGKGRFTDIELEMEKGVLVYAVEYTEKDGNEVDVKINAKTGALVVMESDKDEPTDDDKNDDKDDHSDVNKAAKMQTIINLLNQLMDLLRQKALLS